MPLFHVFVALTARRVRVEVRCSGRIVQMHMMTGDVVVALDAWMCTSCRDEA